MRNFDKFVSSFPELNYLKKFNGGDSLLEWILPYFKVGYSPMKWVRVQRLAVYCTQKLTDGKKIKCE